MKKYYLLLCIILLNGCGQSGHLYLPPKSGIPSSSEEHNTYGDKQ